ncbi:unnamed protein product [Sphacelaria rigidula]
MDKSAEDVAKSAGDAVAEKLEKHGDAFAGFMSGVQSSVFNSISSQSVGPQGFVENFQAFRSAVDWEERWIQGLLAFHVCTFLFFIVTRAHFGCQVGLFIFILVGARSSEYINTYLRNHWQDFSRQNYFDEHGIFMGVMWAGPLILLGFAMLVSLLCQAASLMVAVKTEQFKREIAARKKASAGGGTEKAKRAVKEKDAPKQE